MERDSLHRGAGGVEGDMSCTFGYPSRQHNRMTLKGHRRIISHTGLSDTGIREAASGD